MRNFVTLAVVFGALTTPAAAQGEPAVTDSTARIASGTIVRVQLTDRPGTWYRGELGRFLPSQCVMVLAPQSDDERDGLGGYVTPLIARLETWRGEASVVAGATAKDATDDRQWAHHSLGAVRRHEQSEGCTDPSNL
jgi:hypothetical protein